MVNDEEKITYATIFPPKFYKARRINHDYKFNRGQYFVVVLYTAVLK